MLREVLIVARGLRGRKYSYYESTTAVHFSDLFRYVILLCGSKDRKTVPAVALSRYGYFYRADPWYKADCNDRWCTFHDAWRPVGQPTI